MTSAAGNTTSGTPLDTPEYDIVRSARCPLDPAPAMRARQAEGPLVRIRLWDGTLAWLVTGWEEHRALMSDPRVSVDPFRPGAPKLSPGEVKVIDALKKEGKRSTGTSFILMDDPEHARLRRMVTSAFTIKRVEALRPPTQKITDDLIDTMLAGPKPVDLVEALALPVPSLVISNLLGVPYDDHEFFQANSRTIINRETTAEERAAARGRLSEYLDGLLGEKLAHPREDLLSGLAERIKAGELAREDATEMGVLMLFAGHETTANMITLGTLALLQHPDQLALLRDTEDPKLIASAVDELLRYLTITHGGQRRAALADIEIAGQVIRAGEGIIPVNEIANRDPSVFPDPDRLDIRRDARRHVAFGFGVHQCLGQPLARMELQVVYPTLLRRIPTLALAADLAEIPFKHDGFVYGAYRLPVTW
ncbi:cytochrome P450 [Streptomyces sp. NBS 14/10]|uniref:cytochrome P450 n=1 Tax=Streptomyces sp. NBS 14/10 TaxID=1945643 RepID=UPI000B7E0B40|nr:cytochrome P450 [Streptomyces sp. NBS 14/10]KAK1185710.1 cytochrome P450 [Streptomyces sp. NBS 14/10]